MHWTSWKCEADACRGRRARHASAFAGRFRWGFLGLPVLLTAIFLIFGFDSAWAQQTQTRPDAPPAVAPLQPSSSEPAIPSSIPRPAVAHPAELRFAVVVDAAHGGGDNGAALVSGALEKNYTLALAMRLRVLLNARGIHAILTRSSDGAVDPLSRATTANHAHASACVLLHATATGNGVHLFTSSLAPARRRIAVDSTAGDSPSADSTGGDRRRNFLPWQTAQASYETESLRLESDVNSALAEQHVPVLLDRTSLAPLDSLACPAVAVEVAPLDANTLVVDEAYREKMAQALAAALVAWHSDWRLQP